jgi:hypothetical protein
METIKIKGRPAKQYTIAQSGVLITTFSNPKLPTEEHVPFENIKSDRFFLKHRSPMLLILAGVVLMIFVLIVADSNKNNTQYPSINNFTWPILSLLFLGSYFFLQPRVYFLKTFTGKYIKFNIRKNEMEVAEFVREIITRRNEYLLLKYGTPSSYLSYDAQYSNFNIMAREGIITVQEFHEKIDELNSIFKQTVPAKTFPGYSQN